VDYPFQGIPVMSDADLRRHNRYTWMLIAFSALAIFFMAQQSRATAEANTTKSAGQCVARLMIETGSNLR